MEIYEKLRIQESPRISQNLPKSPDSEIFGDFRRFSEILGDFRRSEILGDSRRFLEFSEILGDSWRFSEILGEFICLGAARTLKKHNLMFQCCAGLQQHQNFLHAACAKMKSRSKFSPLYALAKKAK